MTEPERSASDSTAPSRIIGAGEGAWPARVLDGWHKPVFILCLLCWAGNLALEVLQISHSPVGRWFEGLFVFFTAVSTLLALGRRLPLQNVLSTAIIIMGLSAAVMSLAAFSGIPLGPIHYTVHFGDQLFDILPW